MLNYINAENLKCKHTFLRKVIIFAPLVVFFLPGSFSPRYMVLDAYNWWYILILPGYIALLGILLNQYEEKKKHYMAIFCLPVSLKKIWISKIILLSIYVIVSIFIHLTMIVIGKFVIANILNLPQYVNEYTIGRVLVTSLLIGITYLWQVPFCLFLAKKFGFIITIIVNVVLGMGLNIFFATKNIWWISPYSWGARLVIPVMRILPNGLPAEQGNSLLNMDVIPLGVILSFALYFVLILFTALWFGRQEVRQ